MMLLRIDAVLLFLYVEPARATDSSRVFWPAFGLIPVARRRDKEVCVIIFHQLLKNFIILLFSVNFSSLNKLKTFFSYYQPATVTESNKIQLKP